MTPRPLIYLTGMPRSGTTWIGKIFDSHPDTLYRHEPDSWGRLNAVPLAPEMELANAYKTALQSFVSDLPKTRSTKVAGSLPVFPKRLDRPFTRRLRHGSTMLAKLGARLVGEWPIFEFMNIAEAAQLTIVWKSIESTTRLGLIGRTIAASRNFHIIRHPCGFIGSLIRGEALGRFEGDVRSSEDYGTWEILLNSRQAARYGLTAHALKAMERIERLAWLWVIVNEKAMEDSAGLGNCLTVRYEDICENPFAVARRMFDFAGLSWSAQTEAFIRRSTAKERDAYYSVFKDPIASAWKWRKELPPGSIAKIMNIAADTMPGRLYAKDAVPAGPDLMQVAAG